MNAPGRVISPLGPSTRLERDAVYLSPTGRRCRWWPSGGRGGDNQPALLVYDTRDGRPASSALSEGFTLAPENFRCLRRVE